MNELLRNYIFLQIKLKYTIIILARSSPTYLTKNGFTRYNNLTFFKFQEIEKYQNDQRDHKGLITLSIQMRNLL